MFILTVKEKEEVIIQSFGKFVKTITDPGIHFIMPWQNVARKVGTELKQEADTLSTKTKSSSPSPSRCTCR